MVRLSRRRRAFAVIWAVLQFALPALGTVAEAQLARDASAPDPSGHVEDRSGPGCRPVHAPDCARCQALSMHAVSVAAPAVDWAHAVDAACPAAESAGAAFGPRRSLPPSRAPPDLL